MQLLIKTSEQVLKHYRIAESIEFSTIAPALLGAQQIYLEKILSKEFIADVAAYFDEPEAGVKSDLVDALTRAIVHLGLYHWTYHGNVLITETGVKVTKTDSQVSAFPWQVKALREQLYTDGFLAIEYMLEILESDPQAFAIWHTKVFASYKKLFLRNAQKFNEFYNINSSRALYLELFPALVRNETDIIKVMVGPELFEILKSNPDAENYSDIVRLIRYVLAYQSIADVILQKSVNFERLGVSTFTSSTSSDNPETSQKASEQILTAIQRQNQSLSGNYQRKLRDLLNEKAAAGELDSYKNSIAYSPESGSTTYGAVDNGWIGI